MKKILFVFTALFMAASLAACGAPETPEPASSGGDEVQTAQRIDGTLMPSVFVGTVEDFAVDDDGYTVLLMRRAVGSPYPRELKVTLTEDTFYQFDSNSVANGSFLQVFYYDEPDENGAVYANAIDDLVSEEISNYNGKLVEAAPDPENEGSGTLTLEPLEEGGISYVFLYNTDTLFNVDLDALKPGDLLNVQHSPASTRSLPPQSLAFVISAYSEPEEGELPIPAAGAPSATADAPSAADGELVETPLGTPENPIASEPAIS